MIEIETYRTDGKYSRIIHSVVFLASSILYASHCLVSERLCVTCELNIAMLDYNELGGAILTTHVAIFANTCLSFFFSDESFTILESICTVRLFTGNYC